MPLPSQSKRPSRQRSSVFRAKTQGGSSRFAFLLALVIMLGIWLVMGRGKDSELKAAEQEPGTAELAGEPEARVVSLSKVRDPEPSQLESQAVGDWLDDVELPNVPSEALVPASAVPEEAPAASSASLARVLEQGFAELSAGKLLLGRRTLSEALIGGDLSQADAERVRMSLGGLGRRWILGPEVLAGDPFCSTYKIASGDLLSRLPRKLNLAIDWRFLQRVNAISDPARIRVGQKIKLVRGPFHVQVDKSAFRMDLFLGERDERIFVDSFPVGHGEFNTTPEGIFRVRKDSKLINPAWTNPRTKQRVAADDPENPIGEHWIGLEGVSEAVRDVQQIGIHGTTDLPSIGQMRSMGCVRMRAGDVALIYEVLVLPASRIEIRP